MAKNKAFTMKNASSIASGGYWYPFTEEGKPARLDIEQDFPLKSYDLQNKSSQELLVLLDAEDLENPSLQFDVPNGNTSRLQREENINFNHIVIKNEGTISIGAEELVLTVRNY